MFNGIVEEIGEVVDIRREAKLITLTIKGCKVIDGLQNGDSVAVNGVCLSVTAINGKQLTFDIMQETLGKTTLGSIGMSSTVNLERAMKADARINGHFVSGHVDNTGKISRIVKDADFVEFRIAYPEGLRPYLVPKGSVCLDGVSLTVGDVTDQFFSVYLIPLTLKDTTLGGKREGDDVNIETDLLGKYILNHLRLK